MLTQNNTFTIHTLQKIIAEQDRRLRVGSFLQTKATQSIS